MLGVSEAIMVDGHHEVVIAIGTTAFNLGNLWRHGLSHTHGDQERPSDGTKCAFHRRFVLVDLDQKRYCKPTVIMRALVSVALSLVLVMLG